MYKLLRQLIRLRQRSAVRVGVRILLVVLMVLGLWVATMPLSHYELPKMNDKLLHMVVFFGFALLSDIAFKGKPFWLWIALPLFAYGAFIEFLQHFTAYRSFELADLLADMTGLMLYYLTKSLLRFSLADEIKV